MPDGGMMATSPRLPGLLSPPPDHSSLEHAAKMYRNGASMFAASCTWSGQLPAPSRSLGPQVYSTKVFLGGVPWDVTELCLVKAFGVFGEVRVEWPGSRGEGGGSPKGYLYLVLEGEAAVPALLAHCTSDPDGGAWYYRLTSRRSRSKEVQVSSCLQIALLCYNLIFPRSSLGRSATQTLSVAPPSDWTPIRLSSLEHCTVGICVSL